MYISDLDYLEVPLKPKHSSEVKGGISIEALSIGVAEGSETALTFTTTRTAAVSFSF